MPLGIAMTDLKYKYDLIAHNFSSREYNNLEFYMHHRFVIATTWGKPLVTGDSVVELGCGDGYLAQSFVKHGFHYRGADISSKMIFAAQSRLLEAGKYVELFVADVNQFSLSEPCDVVIAFMRTFFAYTKEPLEVLRRLRPYVRKKIILDLNPRLDMPVSAAIAMIKEAGFQNIAWRPFFVPKEKKLPLIMLKALATCETIPMLRQIPLRWKFHVLVKGEVE